MSVTVIVLIVLLVIAVIALIALASRDVMRRRSTRLQQRFGPEYEHAVEETGGRRQAEAELREREQRHEELHLRALPSEARNRYRQEWLGIQQRFVDVPGQAVLDADELVRVIMRDVGYPVDDFEQRAEYVSVEHPDVVRHFRSAHSVALAQQRGQAETEPLPQAVTDYRVLVDEVLEDEGRSNGTGEGRSNGPGEGRSNGTDKGR
ncbi:hypothetical protein [Actinopolymorpha pittospori]|uniref:Secreted protein n=1 Tax=Actinopolymorpha pittospori TaxID=648752 RepID=A0A927MYI2_9ACTN|nr:hypothetical protein [Actinopolymorpha pittospori]MBE1608669.1 hypothetical protein [Actinopolymorpha pittospori]